MSALIETTHATCALEECPWLAHYPLRGPRSPQRETARRVFDVGCTLLALVVVLPVLAVAALLIKATSPGGPVLFVQRRTGFHGRTFRLFKLRTMAPDADAQKAQLADLNARQWPDFKIEHDPRITRVGRVLRATSIDELPQLFNVLRGDMTLVGPRPTSIGQDRYRAWQYERFDVRPGLTGLWQVSARNSSSFDHRLRLDIADAGAAVVAPRPRDPRPDRPCGHLRARCAVRRAHQSGAPPMTADALLAYLRRSWWFVALQALAVVVVVTMILAGRDETSYTRTVHFVLHPASDSRVGDVNNGIDVSGQDGPLVQTILKVLGSGELLGRAAAEGGAGDVSQYEVTATVAPGSNYFDVTVAGPAARTVERLGDGLESVAPAYVESSYNGFQFEVLGRDDGSQSSFPPGADLLLLALLLGAIAGVAELSAVFVLRHVRGASLAAPQAGPPVPLGHNGRGGSPVVAKPVPTKARRRRSPTAR